MKKEIENSSSDLLQNILSGKTKEPISRENWISYVKSAYTVENTLFLMDIRRFGELYQKCCDKIGIPSNIAKGLKPLSVIDGMICTDCYAATETLLKIWAEDICSKTVETYIKVGSKFEINIASKLREDCLRKHRRGEHNPSLFFEIEEAFQASILANDFPKFKLFTLDQNIEVQHVYLRLYFALVFAGFASLLFGLLMGFSCAQYYRLFGFPLLYVVFVSYFQYRAKFCVTFAAAKRKNTKGYYGVSVIEDEYACKYQGNKSKNMKQKSVLYALAATIVFFVVPPYQWM